MKKDLTILVMTYNRFTYTKYAMDTLARHIDFSCVKEVLIGDAGSTDGTRELIENYDFVTKIYDVPHGNIARNIRTGARKASGEYFLIMGNDIFVPPDWNSKALEALKFGQQHGIDIVNYDMPDTDLEESVDHILIWNRSGKAMLARGAPWERFDADGFSLQKAYQAGGLWITTRDLLLSKTKFGRLGDMVVDKYYGCWFWLVYSFQGQMAIRLPRLGCVSMGSLPDLPQDMGYSKVRLEDPLVKEFLFEEDPNALREEYETLDWMRKVDLVKKQ